MTVQTVTTPYPPANGLQPMSVSVTHAGLDALHRWVQSADEAAQLVSRIIDTPFVPESYRPQIDPRATPEQRQVAREVAIGTGTAAVLLGISIGLDPLTALQQIYVVHGRPGMYTKIKVALVQAAGHEVWTEDQSGTRAVVRGRRKGSEIIETVTITMDMARAAGWTRNAAYGKTPADMLWARAAGRVCDRIASDVLNGIASVEDIEDELSEAQPVKTRTVRRSQPAASAASERPALPGETVEPAGPDSPPQPPPAPATQPAEAWQPPLPGEDAEPVSEPPAPAERPAETGELVDPKGDQMKRLHASFNDIELSDRDDRLYYVQSIVKRPIESSLELTVAEASRVIDALNAERKPADDREGDA